MSYTLRFRRLDPPCRPTSSAAPLVGGGRADEKWLFLLFTPLQDWLLSIAHEHPPTLTDSPASVVERRLLLAVPGVHLCPKAQQEFHDHGVTPLASGVKGGAQSAVPRVHGGPVFLHQQLDHVRVALFSTTGGAVGVGGGGGKRAWFGLCLPGSFDNRLRIPVETKECRSVPLQASPTFWATIFFRSVIFWGEVLFRVFQLFIIALTLRCVCVRFFS